MIFKNDEKNKKYIICPWVLSYNTWVYLLDIKCLSRQSELEIKQINNERIYQLKKHKETKHIVLEYPRIKIILHTIIFQLKDSVILLSRSKL